MDNKNKLSVKKVEEAKTIAFGIRVARGPLLIRIIKFIGKSFIFWIIWAIVVKLLSEWIFSTLSKGF